MAKTYKAVIYCRLSKEDGDKVESNSISNQKSYCEAYASKLQDVRIVHPPIVDDGVSGVSFEREGFKKLEAQIQKGKIDCVIVRDLSRFSRNYIDAGRYLEQIFPRLGVRFIAINDHYDSTTSDPQSDSFILPFKNLVNVSFVLDTTLGNAQKQIAKPVSVQWDNLLVEITRAEFSPLQGVVEVHYGTVDETKPYSHVELSLFTVEGEPIGYARLPVIMGAMNVEGMIMTYISTGEWAESMVLAPVLENGCMDESRMILLEWED